MDELNVEQKHNVTVKLKAFNCNINQNLLNFIDTPGHVDFSWEVKRSILISDLCLVLIDISKGIQSQTFEYMEFAKKHNTPLIFILNKTDLQPNDKFLSDFCHHYDKIFNFFKPLYILKSNKFQKENEVLDLFKSKNLQIKKKIYKYKFLIYLFYVLDILTYTTNQLKLLVYLANGKIKINDIISLNNAKYTITKITLLNNQNTTEYNYSNLLILSLKTSNKTSNKKYLKYVNGVWISDGKII